MNTIGATILKQLQALSSRANTLLHRTINDALPTARMLQREVRDVEGELRDISANADRAEAKLMLQANQALEELKVTR